MSNDMTWEQKCRISALRAACASAYDLRYTQAEGETLINSESDEDVSRRILARAETFRVALLGDGPLDDRYHSQESLGPKSDMKYQQFIGTCKHCLTAIQLIDPFNDETARWIDNCGLSLCGQKPGSTQVHEPELEESMDVESDWCNCQAIPESLNYPGPWHKRADEPHYPCAMSECPGCGSSRKDTPLMINDGMGDSLQCNRAWHRE